MRFCWDLNSWFGGMRLLMAGVPQSLATLKSYCVQWTVFPRCRPLPGARPSQACSFDGSLNFNGEIYEPQRRFVSDGSQESEVEPQWRRTGSWFPLLSFVCATLGERSGTASLWLGCFAQQVATNLEPGSKGLQGLGRHNPTVILEAPCCQVPKRR